MAQPKKHTEAYLASLFKSDQPATLSSSLSSDSSEGSNSQDSRFVIQLHNATFVTSIERLNHSTIKVLDLLGSKDVSEDDMPEQLHDLLTDFLPADTVSVPTATMQLTWLSASLQQDIDKHVLAILHRNREDVAPTGQVFSPPVTPIKPSLSRSSSFRRAFTPTLSAPAQALPRHPSERFVPSRPHSPSPLRLQKSTDSFKELNVTASEFRPRTPNLNSPSVAQGILPSGAPAAASTNLWGYSNSPLGTPRGLFPNSGDSPQIANATLSYFPSKSSPALIPRDPWGQSHSNTSASSESSAEESFDPFANVSHMAEYEEDDSTNSSWSLSHNMPSKSMNFSSSVSDREGENTGLTGSTAPYSMTPLDLLYSIFADSGISAAELEDALARAGWDVDRAMEDLLASARPPQTEVDQVNKHMSNFNLNPRSNHLNRPLSVSRDSFDKIRPGSPSSVMSQSPRWNTATLPVQRPLTPNGLSPGYPSAAASNRVCRYYLQGSCLRSDCRYNHDISKAICRFWLKGHCLKGSDRCDFMHMIPPHLAQDVAMLRLKIAAQDRRAEGYDSDGSGNGHFVPRFADDEDDFPTLGAGALPANRPRRDPATSRWSAAVKSSRESNRQSSADAFLSSGQSHGQGSFGTIGRTAPDRPSPRIPLRPPTLLPTLTTGFQMSEAYATHRQKFLDLGAARAKCLSKAAEAYRRGDGAGARYWSREAQTQDLDRLQAGREAAESIMLERRRLLKQAVSKFDSREGKADLVADRSARGKEMGDNLGICLGVAVKASGTSLSPEERTEVCIDLHGLHAEEATDVLSKFFTALERESFYGLAYLVAGQEKHSVQGQVRTKLNDSITEFLDQYKYPYRIYGGIFAVDPRHHI